MPDSYICSKYKGSLQNGESLEKGGLVPSVRGSNSEKTMLYRLSENGLKLPQPSTMAGKDKSHDQEPEWISLSRKLCAKFVEDHIEHNSSDSFHYEEPIGVKPAEKSSPPLKTAPSCEPTQRIEKKAKVAEIAPQPHGNEEPPWIPLSRKLCTKFIEEHIEYPVPALCNSLKESKFVEPNGDVRIIEKIGKPKVKKSRMKKESEPEWVSISRKLRAKFIESHIDDPDTISLENQLNASDPEETSSGSLSDSSQEVKIGKMDFHDGNQHKVVSSNCTDPRKKLPEPENESRNNRNSISFPEKECCWEYQEMEFDQESNSGTFQEHESFEQQISSTPIPVAAKNLSVQGIKVRTTPAPGVDNFSPSLRVESNNMSFAQIQNFQNAECYNNDVRFAPSFSSSTGISNNSVSCFNPSFRDPPETANGNFVNKQNLFTVQFVAHTDGKLKNSADSKQLPQTNSGDNAQKSLHGSFFNLTTWEEAHFKPDDTYSENNGSELDANFRNKLRSKSMDNICEKDERLPIKQVNGNEESSEKRRYNTSLTSKEKPYHRSEDVLNKLDNKTAKQNFTDSASKQFTPDEVNGVYSPESSNSTNSSCEMIKRKGNASYSSENEGANRKSPTAASNSNHKSIQKQKQYKCNGVIPNSMQNSSKSNIFNSCDTPVEKAQPQNSRCELESTNLDKRMNISQSKDKIHVNEYANIKPPFSDEAAQQNGMQANISILQNGGQSSNSHVNEKIHESRQKKSSVSSPSVQNNDSSTSSCSPSSSKESNSHDSPSIYQNEVHHSKELGTSIPVANRMKYKSNSLCDIPSSNGYFPSLLSTHRERKSDFDNLPYVVVRCKDAPTIEFQDFEFDSEIPLCAKLVSKQNGKHSTRSVSSSSNMNGSICSASSHVYEDMFKESTTCPSDSEASSWTVMKNNTYYVNGRSSSMNDLDLSDSCSLSVKCDYASSCSDQSTLRSRRSSCESSSFYVNLRDYDSHMMEPSMNRKKKDHRKTSSNGNFANVKSNPPTPESLRQLFTSPLSSIHSPPNRIDRAVNRLPTDPQSQYYSTTAASSAFKHGFDPAPLKPKKSERSSSIKIKDIAHGIILTFRRFQNHSKSSHVSPTHYVDVSHLAESGLKSGNLESEKDRPKNEQKEVSRKKEHEKSRWGITPENSRTDSDSGCQLTSTEIQRTKARRCSSDLTGTKPNIEIINQDTHAKDPCKSEKKKVKNGKKNLNIRGKTKKNSRSKPVEPRAVPTVSRKVQQMADGTLYLVTTVSGDTALPGVYSDSPDTSSELSSHKPVKLPGESNC